jgi:exodeoxyribonuclease VIII
MSFINCKVIGDGISYEVYSRQVPGVKRGDPAFIMSRSEIVAFAVNPEKWLASKNSPDTPATIFGRLFECLEMSPGTFDDLFVIRPETYPDKKTGEPKPFNLNSSWCKDWVESQKDKTVIKPEVALEAEAAAKTAQSYAPRVELIACSKKQVMVTGEFKVSSLDIPVRCLLDLVPDSKHPTWGKSLADSKTARNGDPETFCRVINDEGYDIQAALGMDMFKEATKQDRTDWVFPLSENTEPWHVTKPMPAMTAEFLTWGRLKYQSALAYYAQCLATNHWPSYRVFGLPFGPMQLIGPESLWSYRQMAGQGALTAKDDYQPAPQPTENNDVPMP